MGRVAGKWYFVLGDAWRAIGSFDTREQAVEHAKKLFAAGTSGSRCVLSVGQWVAGDPTRSAQETSELLTLEGRGDA